MQLAERTYGPYLTVYRIAPTLWENRNLPNPSSEGRRINTRINDFSNRLMNAWRIYAESEQPITAEMLFAKGTFTLIQLVEGGAVYVL